MDAVSLLSKSSGSQQVSQVRDIKNAARLAAAPAAATHRQSPCVVADTQHRGLAKSPSKNSARCPPQPLRYVAAARSRKETVGQKGILMKKILVVGALATLAAGCAQHAAPPQPDVTRSTQIPAVTDSPAPGRGSDAT